MQEPERVSVFDLLKELVEAETISPTTSRLVMDLKNESIHDIARELEEQYNVLNENSLVHATIIEHALEIFRDVDYIDDPNAADLSENQQLILDALIYINTVCEGDELDQDMEGNFETLYQDYKYINSNPEEDSTEQREPLREKSPQEKNPQIAGLLGKRQMTMKLTIVDADTQNLAGLLKLHARINDMVVNGKDGGSFEISDLTGKTRILLENAKNGADGNDVNITITCPKNLDAVNEAIVYVVDMTSNLYGEREVISENKQLEQGFTDMAKKMNAP